MDAAEASKPVMVGRSRYQSYGFQHDGGSLTKRHIKAGQDGGCPRTLLSLEAMIAEAGGNGPFQKQIIALILASLMMASLLLYALPFLLLLPSYSCFDTDGEPLASYDCIPSNFYQNPNVKAEPVQSYLNLSNWIQEFNLVTVTPAAPTMFFLLIFGGLAAGALCVAPVVDSHRKKVVFVISLVTILVVYVLLLVTTDWTMLMVYVFLYGFALSVCIISGLLLMLQLIPQSTQAVALLCFVITSACMSFYVCAYFRLSKSWRPLFEIAIIFLLISLMFIYFIPESLRHLFTQHRYEELDKKLTIIANINLANEDYQERIGAKQYIKIQDQIARREHRRNATKFFSDS